MLPYHPYLARRCFGCRDIDPDSTRLVESHCSALSDCNRHTRSVGGKAHQPMVVERTILKRYDRWLQPGQCYWTASRTVMFILREKVNLRDEIR